MLVNIAVLLAVCLSRLGVCSSYVIDEEKYMEEPSETCKPQPIYIPWTRVRHYLGEHLNVPIPSSVEGMPLEVMRCKNFLTPCPNGHSYCSGGNEHIVKGTMRLEVKGERLDKNLILEFKEDKNCRCVSKALYRSFHHQDVLSPPYIIRASLEDWLPHENQESNLLVGGEEPETRDSNLVH